MILMTDLLRRRAETQGQRFPVTEMFFDAARGALHYVALRTGGFFNREEVLLSIRAFERPEPGRDGWPVSLDADAVAAAPVWSEGSNAGGFSLGSWPSIIVGPFGNTESPLLLRAQAADATGGGPTGASRDNAGAGAEAPSGGGERAAPEPPAEPPVEPPAGRPIGDGRVYRLERVRRRLGAEVFGSDGPLGHLADLLVEEDDFRIGALQVITDHAQHRVPYEALRHMASEGSHLVLALDAAGLAATPPAHAPAA